MGDLVPRGEFSPPPLVCDGFDFLVGYFIMLARQGENPLSLGASKQCAPNRAMSHNLPRCQAHSVDQVSRIIRILRRFADSAEELFHANGNDWPLKPIPCHRYKLIIARISKPV